MKKKMLYVMMAIAAFACFVPSVMAATTDVSTDLASAVSAAANGDVLKLTADITVDSAITINKELTIDLNGHKITIDDSKSNDCIKVVDGNLTVTGTGTIEEKVPYYGAIWVYGSINRNDTNYSTLLVDENVTLKGYSGVLVRQTDDGTGGYRAYGVDVTVKGTIVAINDGTDTGTGIQVNGNIQPKEGEEENFTNYPVINVEGANITSDGVGIYAAGYATWNISDATISGIESAIAIKSGILNIESGTFTGTGLDKRPTNGFNNGVNPSGAALQIESNDGYAGNIEINITGGTFESEKGVAVYEYLNKGKENDTTDDTTKTTIKSIVITGGEFVSAEDKPVLDLSDEFVEEHSETDFIEGGTFLSGNEESLVETLNGGYVSPDKAIVLTMYAVIDGKVDETLELVLIKGTSLDKEAFEEFIVEALKEENKYSYDAVYTDKDLKTKFDFTKKLEADTVMYVSVTTIPKTGDINLVVLIGTILISAMGIVISSKKRFAKSN